MAINSPTPVGARCARPDSNSSIFILLIVLAISIIIITPLFGNIHIPLTSILTGKMTELESALFWRIRLPRTLTAFIVGGGLSTVGLVLQAYFQNSLASPFTLGVSSGGVLGAVLCISITSITFINSTYSLVIGSLIGGLSTALFLTIISKRSLFKESNNLLLCGVVLSVLLSNIAILISATSSVSSLISSTRWMLGTVVLDNYLTIFILFAVTLFSSVVFYTAHKELDILSFGYEFAQGKGVDLRRLEILLLIFSSLIVAIIVAFCGPIGFIGIIEPFIARKVFGIKHKILLPSSFLIGGIFLCICDFVGRIMFNPIEIPAGLLSGVTGAVAFGAAVFFEKRIVLR